MFSSNLLEYIERVDEQNTTLGELFENANNSNWKANATQKGKLSIQDRKVAHFFGSSVKSPEDMASLEAEHSLKVERMNDAAIIATDLEFNWQYAEVIENPKDNYEKLSKIIEKRTSIEKLIKDIFYQNMDKPKKTQVDYNCYREVLELIKEKCAAVDLHD